MKIDPKLRGFGAVSIAALMLGTAPAALFAETPADTLVVADAIDDIVSLDPHEAYEFSGLDLNNNTYDGLVELDPVTSAMIPGLSDSWTASEDGLTFTFHIKQGITFSSGNPLRAEDAAFSLQRAVKINKTPAFILNQFGWTAENVDTMVTADGENVIIKVDKPYAPTFLYNCLTAGVASIVDEKTVMANVVDGDMGNAWLKNNSAGTGAYTLKSFKPNEGYVLEMRPGHWRGDAKLAKVFMMHVPEAATQRLQIEKGDIDVARELTPTDIEGLTGNADIRIQADVGGQIFYLSFNQKDERFKNLKFLEAMLQSWGPDYPDPNTNSSTFAENPNNTVEAKATGYLAWRNAYDPGELGPLSQAAVLERDPAKRVEMYAELQTKHRETSPFITMFQVAYQTGLRANVKDFHTGGATDSAAYWLISK